MAKIQSHLQYRETYHLQEFSVDSDFIRGIGTTKEDQGTGLWKKSARLACDGSVIIRTPTSKSARDSTAYDIVRYLSVES